MCVETTIGQLEPSYSKPVLALKLPSSESGARAALACGDHAGGREAITGLGADADW
jgi:hypothetical protein